MRSIRLTTLMLLSMAIAATVATPLKRQSTRLHHQLHAARQVEATTPEAVQARTGYPAAGFRPHISFELPNERKTTELPDVINIPAAVDAVTTVSPVMPTGAGEVDVDVEVIVESNGEEENDENVVVSKEVEKTATTTEAPKDVAESEIEVQVEVNKENTDEEIETHTPAIEYGPPDVASDDKVVEPAEHFQPPNKDAEEFVIRKLAVDGSSIADAGGAANYPNTDAPVQPVANFPADITPAVSAIDDNNSGAGPIDISAELDAEAVEQPMLAATYGPPTSDVDAHLPAETYGSPDDEAVAPPEVEEEDFGLELNELEPMAAKEEADLAAEQIELLSGFSELQSGRLIFVPSDGSNLRQIFFAPPPQQRSLKKSERLMRI